MRRPKPLWPRLGRSLHHRVVSRRRRIHGAPRREYCVARWRLFQKRSEDTRRDIEASKPLAIPPEKVLEMTEAEWYAKSVSAATRRSSTVRAGRDGLGASDSFLAFTNLYIGLIDRLAPSAWPLTACITFVSIERAARWVKSGLAKTPLSILENNCISRPRYERRIFDRRNVGQAFPALLLLSATAVESRGTHPHWALLAAWGALHTAMLGVTLWHPDEAKHDQHRSA